MATSKIFFSYSRLDSAFALQLAKDIRSSGVDIWIDQLDIPAGNHWDSAVEKALSASACVLVILSPSSTSSTNVMDEVSFALESGKKIIPVLLEDCVAPFRIRRLQRIDFTKDYNAGLTQLVASFDYPATDVPDKPLVPEQKVVPQDDPFSAEKKAKEEAERESRMWDIACKLNTIAAYEKYLKDMVTGEFNAEAKLLINQLILEQKEDELEASNWKRAKTEHSIQAYREYLKSYPDRNYKTLALAAIAELEAVQKEEQKREEAKRQEEKRIEEKRKEEERLEAKRLEELRQQEKREEAKKLEEKKKEDKRIEDEKKAAKRLEDQRQEEIRKEQKRQEAVRKEQEKKAKQEQKKLAALAAVSAGASTEDQTSSSLKKYVIIGIGVIMVGLLVWLLIGNNGAKKRDQEAWISATKQPSNSSYSAYMAQFPSGEYVQIAQLRIDSIKARQQTEQDSTDAAVVAKHVKDSLDSKVLEKPKTATSTPPPPTTTTKTKPTPSTTTSKTKPTTTTTNQASIYKLGQSFQGGIIYFIDKSGEHGLIMSEKDLGSYSYETALKKVTKFTAGNSYAWRIPSKDELTKLFAYQQPLNSLSKGNYWSSTPDQDNYVWSINMVNGKPASSNKSLYYFVRAVKSF